MKRLLWRVVPLAAIGVLALAGAAVAPHSASSRSPVANNVLRHALDVELGRVKARPGETPISSGVLYTLLDQTGALNRRAAGSKFRPGRIDLPASGGCQSTFTGNGQTNIRVDQDCSLRSQAGEVLAIDPLDENRMVVGQNDSRIGFNHCGYDWSFDAGLQWSDQTPPFFQFQLPDEHTADACADPSITWDSSGNAYIGGLVFDSSAPSNAVVVAKSNAGIDGAYFHSPDSTGGFQEYRATPLGVIASDDDPNINNDKPVVVADSSSSSPKHDNVYVTWTRFMPEAEGPGGVREVNPIMFSESTDGGATWSPMTEISGEHEGICPTECAHDQGSHPVVGPDGTIYVVFANYDSPDGKEQVLFVKCPADENCEEDTAWTEPTRVDKLIAGHPTGPSAAGCSAGAQCLPPNGYRVSEATSVSTSVDPNGNVFVVWADFRNNTNTGCTGPAASATPPCDNDVFYAYSSDEGETWRGPIDVTPRSSSRFGETAQWQPWSEVAANGHLWVVFYDRSYGTCETTGCNDVTAAEITDPASPSPSFQYSRVTTESMPNLVSANDPIEAGSLGDRMWVDTDSQSRAHVVWADTRQHAGSAPEEDVYYARVPPLSGPPPPPPPPSPPPPPPPPPQPPAPPPPPPPPANCRVPNVIGLTLGRARTKIRSRHCTVGRVRRARSRRVGKVIGQSPKAGAVKRNGFPVKLVVGRR